MPESRLRELLEQLHAELENATDFDAEAHELLARVRTDIQGILARSRSQERASSPLLGRLRELTQRVEGTHPTLVTSLEQFVDALGKLGL